MTDPPRMARPRVAAGVLFRDEEGRVLLVKPTYKEGWDLPGGYVEPGESPRAAAEREVHEELGLTVEVERLLVVDWAPHPDEGDKLLFIFEGGALGENTAAISLRQGEIETVDFVGVDAFPERMPDRLARRVALSAASFPGTAYAEHGRSDTAAAHGDP